MTGQYYVFFFVHCIVFICFAEHLHTEKRSLKDGLLNTGGIGYALLVGLDDCDAHPSDSIPKLKHAESDVKRMYELLDNQLYTIMSITGKDATVEVIEKAIQQLSDSAKDVDRILFYFSGHGIMLRDSKPLQNYTEEAYDKDTFCILLKKPADQSYYHEYLAMPWIVQTINQSKALQRVIIVDACFSGKTNPEIIPYRDIYNHILSNANYFSLTTWADIVYENDYTNAIISGLEGKADKSKTGNSDGKVDAFEIASYVNYIVGNKIHRLKGELYYARMAFIGSGTLFLTGVNGKK